MKKFLLLSLLMVSSLTGWAYDVKVDGIYYDVMVTAKTAEVTYGDAKYTGNVEVPASIVVEGVECSVTSIGYEAFCDCSGLTSVTIPNSVTSIGKEAFYDCSGLTSVTIPNSVTSIGSSAFSGCSGLTSVTIPNSVTSIGMSAFSGCSGLTSVTIPNSVTSIGNRAFYLCSGLTSVTIPNSVTSIGWYAFSGCSGLTSVTIPNSVTSIGKEAFYGCSGLTSVTIPNSVTSIGYEAFSGCSGLTSVTIPNSVTSIGSYAFINCYKIKTVNWDANLSSSPFSYSKSSIQEVVIGDNVSIVYPIFSGYTNLQKVTLGKNVTQLRAEAFKGSRIREFYITGDEAPYCYPNVFQNVDLSQAKLYVPAEKKEYYENNEPWMNFGQIIPVAIRGNALEALNNTYEAYKDYNFKAGTEVGQYGKEEVKAFNAAKFEATNILSDDGDYTTDEIMEALETLKATYQAVLDSEVKGIELADGTAYTETTSQTMKKLTYTRTFNNTSWQPLYVPFSMSPADWEAQGLEVARINGFYEYDDDENGTVDRSALEVLKVKSGRLMSNHPYLVRAKSEGEVTIELDDATVYPAEENGGYCCTFETGYTFMGTYSSVSAAELNAKGAYIMSGGSLKPSASSLKPMRWYMVRKSLGGQLLPELAEIKVFVHGEEEADALDFVNAESTHGEAYNLMGQKVDSKSTKGIVITNGKKVLR